MSESVEEVQRQLRRLRAAAESVLLVGGSPEEVRAVVDEAINAVESGPMAAMAQANRQRIERERELQVAA